MTTALLVAALAVLCGPRSPARDRLRSETVPRTGVRGTGWFAAVLAAAVVIGVALVVEPTAGMAAGIVVATAAHRSRRARRARRRASEVTALLAGLEVAVADLRVGAHPESACLAAADESAGSAAGSSGTAAAAFRSAAATARLGGSAAQGLLTGTHRDRSDGGGVGADLDRIAAAWRIAERHGIALADLLDAARVDLLGRIRFRSRVESGMAGARATAIVLAGLPVLGIALGQMMGAGPVRVLLSGGLGGVLLVVGTALGCAGLAWSDRITRQVTA